MISGLKKSVRVEKKSKNWSGSHSLWEPVHAPWCHAILRRCSASSWEHSVYFRPHFYHRTSEDFLLLRAEAKNTRHCVLLRRDSTSVLQETIHWNDSGNFWIPQSLWRLLPSGDHVLTTVTFYWNSSDSTVYSHYC